MAELVTWPRVLRGDDDLDIRPKPRRAAPSQKSLDAIFQNPRFWVGAKTSRTEMSYGRGQYTELDDEKAVNERLIADGYFEIAAALIARKPIARMPEFLAWRHRSRLASDPAPIANPKRRPGRPRKVTA